MNEMEKVTIQNKYHYKGPISDNFGVLTENFETETWAKDEDEALRNVSFQYKNYRGFSPNFRIKKPNKKYIKVLDNKREKHVFSRTEYYYEYL